VAQAIRYRVNARLKPGAARRAFWERFVDRVFLDTPEEGVETRLMAEVDRLVTRPSAIGRVTIVGAGPGDAELLTLKAVRALQAADVILFDEWIPDDVLELARREARRVPVAPSATDSRDIAALVGEGKRVVRLRSGNPMALAGAVEEIAALESLGIPVEIVPGVEAAPCRSDVIQVAFRRREVSQPGLRAAH
jgi:uroporphyrin-III C-methyltransferase/precorrin-2 dehydrogenase/sirohydrochlorin ferrochelatase